MRNAAELRYDNCADAAMLTARAIFDAIADDVEGRKNWGDAGSMGYIADQLAHVAAAMNIDGYEQD